MTAEQISILDNERARTAKAQPASLKRVVGGDHWSYRKQFQHCNAIGLCIHMSKANHDAMPKKQQKEYAKHKRSMSMADDYFGPRGPLFCAESPGCCSSKHCPLREADNDKS